MKTYARTYVLQRVSTKTLVARINRCSGVYLAIHSRMGAGMRGVQDAGTWQVSAYPVRAARLLTPLNYDWPEAHSLHIPKPRESRGRRRSPMHARLGDGLIGVLTWLISREVCYCA